MRSIEKVLFSMTMHQFTSRLTTWKEQSFVSSDSRNSLCTLESNVSKRTITAKFEACAAPRRSPIRSLVPTRDFHDFQNVGRNEQKRGKMRSLIREDYETFSVFGDRVPIYSVREMISDLVFYVTGKGNAVRELKERKTDLVAFANVTRNFFLTVTFSYYH